MRTALIFLVASAWHSAHAQVAVNDAVRLSPERIKAIGLQIQPAEDRAISRWIRAPGQVEINSYKTSSVTTRIPAQIVRRHVRLGEPVSLGDPIVTLSSVEMAEAQGELQGSFREWQRVQKLGRDLVGEARYVKAQIAFRQANARVRAFGMTESEAKRFLDDADAIAIGEFRLLAPRAGVIFNDHFLDGALVEPGEVLTMIADESVARVEAYLFPEEAEQVKLDATARIQIGSKWYDGKVRQKHHLLDPKTRTMAVRIEIENFDHSTHPGQFVNVEILAGQSEARLVISPKALLRDALGRHLVFRVRDEGVFESVLVVPGEQGREGTSITGLEAGDLVVVDGGLYLLAELNQRAPRQVSH